MITKSLHWKNTGSVVSKIDIDHSPMGKFAILHAGEAGMPGDQQQLATHLLKQGFQAVPSVVDGENVLMVALGRNEKSLTRALHQAGAISGEPQVEFSDAREQSGNFLQRAWVNIQRNATRLDGTFGCLGHVFLYRRGRILDDESIVSASKLYGAATIILAAFGNGAQALNASVENLANETRHQLSKSGIEIEKSEYETTHQEMQDNRNILQKFVGFVSRNPILVNASLGIPGNLQLVKSGLDDRQYTRAFAGATAAAGALTASLLPEKAVEDQRMPENPGPIRRFISFVQERPVRIMGLNQLLDNALMWADVLSLKSTYTKRMTGWTDKDGTQHASHYELRDRANQAISDVLLGGVDWNAVGPKGTTIAGRIQEWRKEFLETERQDTPEAKLSLEGIMESAKATLAGFSPDALQEKWKARSLQNNPEHRLQTVIERTGVTGLEKLHQLLDVRGQVESELATAEKAEASDQSGSKNPFKNAYTAAIASLGLWTMSSAMTAITSKQHGSELGSDGADKSWLEKQGPAGKMVLGRYAQMALAVAPEDRGRAITEMATHLSTVVDKFAVSAEEIRQNLTQMVEKMEENRFVSQPTKLASIPKGNTPMLAVAHSVAPIAKESGLKHAAAAQTAEHAPAEPTVEDASLRAVTEQQAAVQGAHHG
jgi:hypothetical protein